MENFREIYSNNIEKYSSESNDLNRAIKSSSWLRIFSFVGTIFFIYLFGVYEKYIFLILSVFMLVIFIYMIAFYLRIKKKKRFVDLLLKINRNELDVIENSHSFLENGSDHYQQFTYSDDLDIFGQGSIFHIMNRCGTQQGLKHLTKLLMRPLKSKQEIADFQEAAKELGKMPDFRQRILAHALNGSDDRLDDDKLIEWIKKPVDKTLYDVSRIYGILGPALFIAAVVFYIFTSNSSAAIVIATINLFFSGILFKKINDLQQNITKSSENLYSYSNIFKEIQDNKFSSSLLKKQCVAAGSAMKSFRELAKISEAFDRRMNLLTWVLLNGTILHDLHPVVRANKWKKKNADNINNWFSQLGTIESINSISTFYFNNPEYVFPEIVEDDYTFEANELGHPLINKSAMVSNDIRLGPKPNVFIVTGSNMSGKSTFLRTLGINLILSRIGAPVCAASLKTYPFEILTSIKLADSLKENKSLFFTELERLQNIIETSLKDTVCMVLIDEMLKGTNSDDKYFGSAEFAKRVRKLKSLYILATHDIKLGDLENDFPSEIKNYCFESTIEKDEISFDYKIREGISKNRNASFLMRKMNIIDN